MSVSRTLCVAGRLSRASVKRLLDRTVRNIDHVSPESPGGWRGVEMLENRVLLSAVSWVGTAHDNTWGTATNWSTGNVPTTGDVVTIGSGYGTIKITAGTAALGGLSSQSSLNLSGGTLSSSTPVTMSQNLLLTGGTISNTTLQFTSGAELAGENNIGGILDGVTIEGNLDLSQLTTNTIQVRDGLTMGSSPDNPGQPAQILVGNQAGTNRGTLNFTGTSAQSLAPEAGQTLQVIFGGSTSNQINNDVQVYTSGTYHGATVTLTSGVAVSGKNGYFNGYSSSPNKFADSIFLFLGTVDSNSGGTISLFANFQNQGTMSVENTSGLDLEAPIGNLGAIAPLIDASTLTIGGGNYTINEPISVGNGGILHISVYGTNASTINLTDATLYLYPGTTPQTGTINATDSAINLLGTFTLPGLGMLNRTGGSVSIDSLATLNNTGSTLALSDTTGPWILNGGVISGGTISESGSGELLFSTTGGNSLNGVTILGNLDLSQMTGSVNIQGGLTMGTSPDGIAPQILIGNDAVTTTGSIVFSGTTAQTVAPLPGDTIEIRFGGTGSDKITNDIYHTVVGGYSSEAVTLAAGVTVDGRNGQILTGTSYPNNILINQGSILGNGGGTITGTLPILNQGTIETQAGSTLNLTMTGDAGSIQIDPSSTLILGGTFNNNLGLTAPAGSSLTVGGTWTNSAPISATNATLALTGTFANNNTITATNSTTNLTSAGFTVANLGTFNRSGGTVNLSGTLTNTGATLALNNTTGPWNLYGGVIIGGTVTESGTGQLLILTNFQQDNLLDGVTVYGNLDITTKFDGSTDVRDGLTMGASSDTPNQPPVILLGNAAGTTAGGIDFLGSSETVAPVAGQTMEIRFGTYFNDNNSIFNGTYAGSGHGGSVTFAPGVTIDGDIGQFGGTYSDNLVINQGTIDSSGGGKIQIAKNLQNQGTLRASNGTLDIFSLTNLSAGTLTGGTYEIDNTGILNLEGSVTTNAASVTLNGAGAKIISNSYNNANAFAALKANAAGASLTFTGGQSMAITPSGGTLTNDGSINLNGGSTISVTGAFTQNADGALSVQLASNTSFGRITATGAATLGGAVQTNLAAAYDPASSVTFPILTGSTLAHSATFAPNSTASGRNLILRFSTTQAIVAVLPLAPTAPDMTASTDLGISQTDNITSDNAPQFSGTSLDAGTIQLYAGSTLVGTAAINGDGSWTVMPAAGLADGSYQVTAQVLDTAGDLGPASGPLTITIDTVAPTITASINPADSNTGWYNIATGPAVVQYTASDNAGGSGLASSVPGNVTFSDGAGQSLAAVTISDIAGNTATSQSFSEINQDTVAPTITASINPADSTTGWYNIATGPAIVQYTASDNAGGSGLASAAPGNVTFADGSNQSLAAVTISDIAGNTATSQSFSGINQDTVAPTISASINPADSNTGWYNIATGPAIVQYTASDNPGGSGLASSVPGNVTFSDGSNQSLAAVTISDVAGNTATSQSFSGINQDTVAPTISASINAADANTGWYNIATGPAIVQYTASDNAGGSGLASAAPANVTFSDGSNQSLAAVTISDVAGNTATSQSFSGINQDTVAPTISASINPADSNTGWYNIATGPAIVQYTASDNAGGSGLASSVPANVTFSDGSNQSLAAVTISDIAGNTATSQSFSGINQDTVAPTVVAQRVTPANSNGWNNTNVTVSYTATDATSGIDSANSDPTSATLTSEAAGQSVTFTAVDLAGNSATATVNNINIDKTPPTLTATVDRAPDSTTGWYNQSTGAPIVNFAAGDSLSGIDTAASDNLNPVTLPQGANVGVSRTVYDLAGNSAVAGVSGLKIDLTAPAAPSAPQVSLNNSVPTFSGTADPGTTVAIYANDPMNPVATIVADANGNYTVTGSVLAPGGYSITASSTDQAGNVSPLSPPTVIQVNSQTASVVATNVLWGTVGNEPLYLVGNLLLPAGRANDLPWIYINRVHVTLSQAATLTAADVSVTGINTANYGPVTVTGSGNQYTITFAKSVSYADRVKITIGNQNVATFTGTMNILPGDVNDDGKVYFNDITPVLISALKLPGAHPSTWQDINGDGKVDAPDVIDALISFDETLPA